MIIIDIRIKVRNKDYGLKFRVSNLRESFQCGEQNLDNRTRELEWVFDSALNKAIRLLAEKIDGASKEEAFREAKIFSYKRKKVY